MKNKKTIEALVGTALLAAIVVVLQCFIVIPMGAFTVTLTLLPIMLGAVLYGPKSGAVLGGVFGAVVSWQVVTGAAGVLSSQMFQMAPAVTIVVCLIKGIAAGLGAGLIYTLFTRSRAQSTVGALVSAVSCPLINTGIFVAALFLFYYDLMVTYAADNAFADAFAFVFVGIVGLNFLVELAVNVALLPAVLSVIRVVKRCI